MMTETALQAGVLAGADLLSAVGRVPSVGAARATIPPPPRLRPEFRITSDVVVEGQEWYEPDVVYNPNRGMYFVVAHSDQGTSPSIHGQHVTQSGALADWLWTIYGRFEGIDAIQPAVAYNSFNGDYLVVWMRRANSNGGAYEIWGRIFDEMGFVASDPFKVFSWANRSFWSPRVAYNAFRNEYFVIWNAFNTSGGLPGVPNDIAGCRISAGGNILAPCPISITTEANPHQVDIAYNLVRDEYLVVWVRSNPASPTGTGNDIYGALLSWNGVVLTPPGVIAIGTEADDEDAPAVAVDAAGHYMIVWERAYVTGDRDIRGQEFDGFGATVGSRMDLTLSWFFVESRPAITDAPGSREWLAVYQVDGGTGTAVNAVRWGPSAYYAPQVFYAAFWEVASSAVATGDATFLIAYEGDSIGNPTIDRHIYGRIMAAAIVFLPLTLQNGP